MAKYQILDRLAFNGASHEPGTLVEIAENSGVDTVALIQLGVLAPAVRPNASPRRKRPGPRLRVRSPRTAES